MKNTLAYLTLVVASVILISSCSKRSISLTKRHYRNGYYLEYTSTKKSSTKNTTIAISKKIDRTEQISKKKTVRYSDNFSTSDHSTTRGLAKQESVSKNEVLTNTGVKQSKNSVTKIVPFIQKNTNDPIINKLIEYKNTSISRHKQNRPWVWAVIILLFAIWFFGMRSPLAGISWLLYFLLVIGIVLLIVHLAGLL